MWRDGPNTQGPFLIFQCSLRSCLHIIFETQGLVTEGRQMKSQKSKLKNLACGHCLTSPGEKMISKFWSIQSKEGPIFSRVKDLQSSRTSEFIDLSSSYFQEFVIFRQLVLQTYHSLCAYIFILHMNVFFSAEMIANRCLKTTA